MELFGEWLGALGQSIERLISSKTVIGDPIIIGEITLVPVVNVVFGVGSGGSAFATGARVSPQALIVVRLGQVEVYPLSAGNPVERILDRLPSLTGAILDKIREPPGGDEPGDWQ